MSFGDHLDELRKRVVWAILGPIPVFVLCLVFGSQILGFLAEPLLDALTAAGQQRALIATSPLETFIAYLKVSMVVTVLLSFPWILYQLWLFIAPGLYANERRFVYFLMPLSGLLTLAAGLFLYYVLLPISLYFLIVFGSSVLTQATPTAPLPEGVTLPVLPLLEADPEAAPPGAAWFNTSTGRLNIQIDAESVLHTQLQTGGLIAQQYRVGEYVSLVFWLGLAFAVAFQLPAVLLLLSWLDIVAPRDVTPYRKQIMFGCAIAASILTPQDPWSMLLLGLALYGLFELGIVLMRVAPAHRVSEGFGVWARREADEAGGEGPDGRA